MNILSRTLDPLEILPARTFGGLTVFRLIADRKAPGPRSYRTLDEAIAAGTARVTEVGRAGHVPELCFVNEGDLAVLLVDGEELAGAKQNRILNLTILCPPRKTIVIPVSCVEAGRWRHRSDVSIPEQHVMVAAARGMKAARVSASLASTGLPRTDQGEIWAHVANLLNKHHVASATSEMREVYRQSGARLDEYVAAFPAVDGQVGAIFALGADVRGVELFDDPDTLRALLPKIVRSWALDALDLASTTHEVPGAEAARGYLDRIAGATVEEHASVGLGRDVRILGHRLTGGALVHDDRLVHLCAFTLDEELGQGSLSPGARMIRPSRRGGRGFAA